MDSNIGRALMRRLVTCLVLLVLPSSVLAVDCVEPYGTLFSSPTDDPTVRTFTGNVYPFGQINGALEVQVNPDTGAFTGDFGFKAKGGNVYGTITGQFTSQYTYYETLTFTGGTGRYNHTSGSVLVNGQLDPMTYMGVDTIQPHGQVCVP
jgi:hypothetical protein